MFLDLYRSIRHEKDSMLCIGLDPNAENFPGDVMGENPGETLLNFCRDIIEKTSQHACAYKLNTQFLLFALDFKQLNELNNKIHDAGGISILDHKLGDIGSSNQSAMYWIRKTGFDALTFSPFAGNIKEATLEAHKNKLGIFVLTLMSNPESRWVQKESERKGTPLYKEIADKVRDSRSDGIVVGATDNVTTWDIRELRDAVGEDTVFLCPGIGAQGGDVEFIVTSAGENTLINVGRAIIQDENPADKAKEYKELFNRYR
jgi:orotidine 5'-phosphate decarboxylase subfamily 2